MLDPADYDKAVENWKQKQRADRLTELQRNMRSDVHSHLGRNPGRSTGFRQWLRTRGNSQKPLDLPGGYQSVLNRGEMRGTINQMKANHRAANPLNKRTGLGGALASALLGYLTL